VRSSFGKRKPAGAEMCGTRTVVALVLFGVVFALHAAVMAMLITASVTQPRWSDNVL
jgi:hypothetical protein